MQCAYRGPILMNYVGQCVLFLILQVGCRTGMVVQCCIFRSERAWWYNVAFLGVATHRVYSGSVADCAHRISQVDYFLKYYSLSRLGSYFKNNQPGLSSGRAAIGRWGFVEDMKVRDRSNRFIPQASRHIHPPRLLYALHILWPDIDELYLFCF